MWQSSESVTAAYDKTTLSLQACYKDSGKASFCTWHQSAIKGFWIQSQSQAILRVTEVMNSSHFSSRDRKIRRTKVCLKNRKAQKWKRRDVTARGIVALNITQCAWLPRKELQPRESICAQTGCDADARLEPCLPKLCVQTTATLLGWAGGSLSLCSLPRVLWVPTVLSQLTQSSG